MNQEKTYFQEDVRLYSVKSIVSLDGGEMAINTGILPITGQDDTIIGYGNVFLSGNKLIAEGNIDYSSPERLLIETKSIPLYLHIMGSHSGTTFIPDKLEISPDKPLDARREPLGEIVL
jgi:hypothetical protein